MAIEISNAIAAMGTVTPAQSPAPGTLVGGTGVAGPAIAHPNVGEYNFTLDRPMDQNECMIIVNPRDTTDSVCTTQHVSDTVKTVLVWNGATSQPSDAVAFDFLFLALPLTQG